LQDVDVDQGDVEVIVQDEETHISRLGRLLASPPNQWTEDGVYAWMQYVVQQFSLDSSKV